MDVSRQIVTVSALEAATDALMIALGKSAGPDLEAATAALRAREAALRLLLEADPASRPPEVNARLRRVLKRDGEAAAHMRAEMEALRGRLAETRQLMNSRGRSPAVAGRSR